MARKLSRKEKYLVPKKTSKHYMLKLLQRNVNVNQLQFPHYLQCGQVYGTGPHHMWIHKAHKYSRLANPPERSLKSSSISFRFFSMKIFSDFSQHEGYSHFLYVRRSLIRLPKIKNGIGADLRWIARHWYLYCGGQSITNAPSQANLICDGIWHNGQVRRRNLGPKRIICERYICRNILSF